MYAAIAEALTITLGFALIQRCRAYPAATTVVLTVVIATLIFTIGVVLDQHLIGGLCTSGNKTFLPHPYCSGLASF
ncbi:hypothetical protein [Methylobacterium sp. NEAU K]|uniref:hypothetical protein n=1 Tax=Methylobacterium sp. NEAU K TaxID=3064946 RepID=UPI002732422C|nr:hypothetical protein [Methylobacterium sp. NEAU K]MDP4006364.1 hypothetical protein [Methylobacterium sp. NEAU K]